MKVRYALAAGFVVVVAALLFIRDEGYLGGRAEGGPLTMSDVSANGFGVSAGDTVGFTLGPTLDGEPVEVQSVRPDFRSPGLDFRPARSRPGDTGCAGCPYPGPGAPLLGETFDGSGEIVVGLRAKRPGAYYALDLITDYRRGLRRFRDYAQPSLCIAVGREAECGSVTRPDAPLAELGGRSDYGSRVRDGVARIDEGDRVRLTLTNLTNQAIEVTGLQGAQPDSFALRRGGGRRVRVDTDGCERIDTLRARVDDEAVDVPLTVALECVSGSR